MSRLRQFCQRLERWLIIAMPVLLILVFPTMVLGQIQEEPTPDEAKKSYAMQWGLIVLMVVVAFLVLCKPSFRDEKIVKEKKTKKEKPKGH